MNTRTGMARMRNSRAVDNYIAELTTAQPEAGIVTPGPEVTNTQASARQTADVVDKLAVHPGRSGAAGVDSARTSSAEVAGGAPASAPQVSSTPAKQNPPGAAPPGRA